MIKRRSYDAGHLFEVTVSRHQICYDLLQRLRVRKVVSSLLPVVNQTFCLLLTQLYYENYFHGPDSKLLHQKMYSQIDTVK